MPSRHRFLEPIHNVKEELLEPHIGARTRQPLVFIPGKMVEPIGIEPMTSSLQS